MYIIDKKLQTRNIVVNYSDRTFEVFNVESADEEVYYRMLNYKRNPNHTPEEERKMKEFLFVMANNENPIANYFYSKMLLREGKDEEALKYCVKALRSHLPVAIKLFGDFLRRGIGGLDVDYVRAMKYYEQFFNIVRNNPAQVKISAIMSKLMFDMRDYADNLVKNENRTPEDIQKAIEIYKILISHWDPVSAKKCANLATNPEDKEKFENYASLLNELYHLDIITNSSPSVENMKKYIDIILKLDFSLKNTEIMEKFEKYLFLLADGKLLFLSAKYKIIAANYILNNYPESIEKAKTYLKEVADYEPEAMLQYSRLLEIGLGCKQNIPKALRYLEEANEIYCFRGDHKKMELCSRGIENLERKINNLSGNGVNTTNTCANTNMSVDGILVRNADVRTKTNKKVVFASLNEANNNIDEITTQRNLSPRNL